MSWVPRHRDRQIYCPNAAHVVHLNAEDTTGTFEIKVRNPDSRIRLKVTIYFAPAAPWDPATIDISGNSTLWIYAADQQRLGGSSNDIPITDLDGSTRDAPLAIPVSAGLMGYSREFVTAGDFVKLWLAVQSNLVVGDWNVQIQAQPDGQRLPDAEWEDVKSQIDITIRQISLLGPQGPE